jgi:uncharacterized protein
MTIVILGASGGTGRHVVSQALDQGLDVRALVRDPERANFTPHPRLEVVRVDVRDAAIVAAAINPGDILVSGLGIPGRSEVGTLTAGALAIVAAHPARIVWLGAMGTGLSRAAVSAPIRWLLRKAFGTEYDDKVAADTAVLAAGGIVVHSGPLSDKADNPALTLEPINQMPNQFFPAGAPRASIARLMLDVATDSTTLGGLLAVKSTR